MIETRSRMLLPYHACRLAAAAAILVTFLACSRGDGPLVRPDAAELAQSAPDSFRVTLQTTRGPVALMAHRDWAPHGVDRFYYLVKHHYYDSTYVFRVVDGFVAQFGINGSPVVNDAWRTRRIPDDAVRHSNTRGTVSFASEGPNTRTVQLFINLADNPKLDGAVGAYPPIAQVVSGMPMVDAFYSGYGEGPPRGLGPRQSQMAAQGNAYVEYNFPKLDMITRAAIDQEWR